MQRTPPSVRKLMLCGMAWLLSACSRGDDPHISMCVAEAHTRLTGKVHRLLSDDIAASMQVLVDGRIRMRGAVIINPGTPRELRQSFDCVVEPAVGDGEARVIQFQFNW